MVKPVKDEVFGANVSLLAVVTHLPISFNRNIPVLLSDLHAWPLVATGIWELQILSACEIEGSVLERVGPWLSGL
jgi:hypothetical protein